MLSLGSRAHVDREPAPPDLGIPGRAQLPALAIAPDGTAYLADKEVATDKQVWYLPQLLQGMSGQSVSK